MVVIEVLVSPVLFRHLVLLFTEVIHCLLAGLLPAAAARLDGLSLFFLAWRCDLLGWTVASPQGAVASLLSSPSRVFIAQIVSIFSSLKIIQLAL